MRVVWRALGFVVDVPWEPIIIVRWELPRRVAGANQVQQLAPKLMIPLLVVRLALSDRVAVFDYEPLPIAAGFELGQRGRFQLVGKFHFDFLSRGPLRNDRCRSVYVDTDQPHHHHGTLSYREGFRIGVWALRTGSFRIGFPLCPYSYAWVVMIPLTCMLRMVSCGLA